MYELIMPPINRFGENCVSTIGLLAAEIKLKKALVVTDHNLVKLGIINSVLKSLETESITYSIFDEVKPNPTKENVLKGIEVYQNDKCDFIIGIGGGSSNDCAKAIGMMVSNGGILEDYIGFNKSKNESPKLFMVNTTAGTASEISRSFLISDEAKQEKLIFKDIHTLPYASFNDPNLMVNLPQAITASTGMDALTHAIESYISTGKYPLTQKMSLASTEFIFTSLEEVIKDPQNIMLREQMIYAQTLAGMSFCNSGLGLVHCMAHQLGGVYNLPHGLCNAILLPFVMEFNQQVAKSGFSEIAHKLWPFETEDMSIDEASSYLIQKVNELSEKIGTKVSLKGLGVKEEDIPLLADKTLLDGNLPRNPIQPTKQEVEELFREAY